MRTLELEIEATLVELGDGVQVVNVSGSDEEVEHHETDGMNPTGYVDGR